MIFDRVGKGKSTMCHFCVERGIDAKDRVLGPACRLVERKPKRWKPPEKGTDGNRELL